ncbi:hypothetical protein HPB50_013045 [Hyalomma asiaticum]|uniref:Uncharacterized protein n=1 Tax=Hyalomma asiaticum TaxID=266040 RepID=A0ACB7S4Y4_HYAAI|nr:hypothetical protein HPB50_013045 [Hyalomma asiaticum]
MSVPLQFNVVQLPQLEWRMRRKPRRSLRPVVEHRSESFRVPSLSVAICRTGLLLGDATDADAFRKTKHSRFVGASSASQEEQTYSMRPCPGRKLDDRKKGYEYRLSRARRCIENAFGILVSRWRAFLGTMEGEPELPNNMIQAVVCLHNFLMADTAYCPGEYSDALCGETVHGGEWRHTGTETGTKTVPSNNHPTSAAMALRDEVAGCFVPAEGSLPWQLKVARRY